MSSDHGSFWFPVLASVAVAYAVVALPLSRARRWPRRRVVLWYAGLLLVGVGVAGPVAAGAHADFRSHVAIHLLLGMAAPVLLALSAPVSLVLRALPVRDARRLIRILASRPARFTTHILTAALLNVGGMWVLYTTPLYTAMHDVAWVGVAVQIHTLAAGYLFAAAAIGNDPMPHRPSRRFRAVVLVGAFAAHAVLARSLYARPPAGVPADQAQAGSQLMYYGGDALEVAVIGIFCWQWYRATRPRLPVPGNSREPVSGPVPNHLAADAQSLRQTP